MKVDGGRVKKVPVVRRIAPRETEMSWMVAND